MRRLRVIVLLAGFAVAAQTTGAKVKTVKSLDGIEPGKRVRIEGTVSTRGSTPLTILVLEIAEHDPITIKAHTPAIRHELTNLGGVRVAVEGDVLPLLDRTLPRLDVDRYEVLPPSGENDPIVGMVTMEENACALVTDDGRRYCVVGELAPALCEHAGARVWMVGKKAKRGGNCPSGTTPFTPTGYGVIE